MVSYYYAHNNYSLPAQTVGEELEKIQNYYGKLTAETMLDYMRSNSTPISKLIEWDDAKAAESYRKVQCRQMIKSVLPIQEPPNQDLQVKAFYNVLEIKNGNRERSYVPLEMVVNSKSDSEYVLKNLLANHRRSTQEIADFVKLIDVNRLSEELQNELNRVLHAETVE